MAEEVKQEVPANAPWKLGWAEVAKSSGTIVPEEAKPVGVVETVTKAIKPWLMEWGFIAKEAEKQGKVDPVPTKPDAKKFDLQTYLTKLSKTESNDDPNAKAKTSSATGLHQFTSSTWMEMVNKLDLPYTLSDRKDPAKSEVVAKEFTKKNLEKAKNDLGREPSMTEAYMYHFVGRSAPKLLQAPPEASAVDYITPSQAKANRNVFYNKDGSPKTVKEVITKYEGKFK